MKRSVLIAALSSVAAASALAQSNVTVYGRINQTVERQKVGGTSQSAVEDNLSRIGFKGSEDLGGGLKASFVIEHGFNADTGRQADAAFWDRESTVGLEHASFGKVRLGNMGQTAAYYTIAQAVSLHNDDAGSSADAFYLRPGSPKNMIAYTSPSFGGFSGELQYGLHEATANHTSVAVVNYNAGPLSLAASYVNGAVDTTIKGEEFGLRGLYTMGALTFGGYYVRNSADDAGDKIKRDSLRASVAYAIGAGEIHGNIGWAGKYKVNGGTADATDAKQFTLGYNHNLSKRTKVYGFVTKVDNKANIDYATGTDGADLQSIAVGIRHAF